MDKMFQDRGKDVILKKSAMMAVMGKWSVNNSDILHVIIYGNSLNWERTKTVTGSNIFLTLVCNYLNSPFNNLSQPTSTHQMKINLKLIFFFVI